ncbi:Uncharacterised protein [Pandoraea pnomenusa]|uniref:Uncharacterized protein n=1 Tax=Pandoraea pnomenusa TaxID=93220 RepID=A0A379KD95_9BURK|nr:Uncharacterised protein [Pandoraea pnomenusa]
MADLSDVSNLLVAQVAALPVPERHSESDLAHRGVRRQGLCRVATARGNARRLHQQHRVCLRLPAADRNRFALDCSGVGSAVHRGADRHRRGERRHRDAGRHRAGIAERRGGCRRKPYVYGVQATDTLSAIATALATMISADQPATSSGTGFTVPGAHLIEARVGTAGTIIRELRRQRKGFQITAWGNCFDVRDRLGMAIDQALRAARARDAARRLAGDLSLPEQSAG